MTSKLVRQYFTQDLSNDEKKSYLKYINGDKYSNDWIKKSLIRREPLLRALVDKKCNTIMPEGGICNEWINAKENGICKCNYGHDCLDIVLCTIKSL